MVTLNTPLVEEVHESVEVPLILVLVSETLFGLRVQVRPVAGRIVALRSTLPVKPFVLTTVTVDWPVPPDGMLAIVGLADAVKSWIMYVTLAAWASPRIVPVTATL